MTRAGAGRPVDTGSEPGSGASASRLSVDPDTEVVETRSGVLRPVHLRWRYLGVVAVGGAIGTALREVISTLLPAHHGVGWTVFGLNVAGAFWLAFLLGVLAHRGADQGRRRLARLGLGTGALGGLTSYSTLAESTANLLLAGRGPDGAGLALLSVLAGVVAAALGLTVAALTRSRTREAG